MNMRLAAYSRAAFRHENTKTRNTSSMFLEPLQIAPIEAVSPSSGIARYPPWESKLHYYRMGRQVGVPGCAGTT